MKYDAIIVLPNHVGHDQLDSEGIGRIELGIRQLELGASKLLIFPGREDSDPSAQNTKTLAQIMKDYAIAKGVPEESIVKEEFSKDTAGHPIFLGYYFLRPRNLRDLLLVTSGYHGGRSTYLFNNVLGDRFNIDTLVDRVGTNSPNKMIEDLEKITTFEETYDGILPGDIDAFLDRTYEAHPLYIGKRSEHKEFANRSGLIAQS